MNTTLCHREEQMWHEISETFRKVYESNQKVRLSREAARRGISCDELMFRIKYIKPGAGLQVFSQCNMHLDIFHLKKLPAYEVAIGVLKMISETDSSQII